MQRSSFGGAEQRRAKAAAAGLPVNQHFCHFRTVRLIVEWSKHDLNGAEDGTDRVRRAQNDALAARHARRDAAPERVCLFARQRLHETDGSATLDTIDEQIA